MFITLKTTWKFHNGKERGEYVDVPAGRHEVEIIPNPRQSSNCNWIVLKGTENGLAEGHLRDFGGEEYGLMQVTIEE